VAELRFLLTELAMILLAAAGALGAFQFVPKSPVPVPPAQIEFAAGTYFPLPSGDFVQTRLALKQYLQEGELVVFGSSELTSPSETAVHRMFPAKCGRPALTLGSQGFQSLPILIKLAEARRYLHPKSQVVVILSPVWFAEHGTPSDAFLRFLNPHQLGILARQEDLPGNVREALAREIRTHFDEFTGLYPDWLYVTFPALAKLGRERDYSIRETQVTIARPPEPGGFDWAAAEEHWKEHLKKMAEGNPWNIDNAIYKRLQKHKPPYKFRPLDPREIEKKDLFAVSELLQAYGVHALFIMQPVHRSIYHKLGGYDRLFQEIEQKLAADGHVFQNLMAEPFDLNILENAAHFSDYTWVRLQKEWCAR